jgi:hypothetical protein
MLKFHPIFIPTFTTLIHPFSHHTFPPKSVYSCICTLRKHPKQPPQKHTNFTICENPSPPQEHTCVTRRKTRNVLANLIQHCDTRSCRRKPQKHTPKLCTTHFCPPNIHFFTHVLLVGTQNHHKKTAVFGPTKTHDLQHDT